jgi:MFS family permease
MYGTQVADFHDGRPDPKPDPHQAARLLWHHRDFNRLWFGQGVSTVGSQVTLLALPLTAVLYLHASTGQVGLLSAAGLVCYSGPSLLFGVIADRMRKRTMMIGADLGRTAIIALIPILAWTKSLDMPVMYAAALIQGALTVIFDVAYRSYLPTLVGPDYVLAANARLQGTASVAQVTGPGISGILVELLGAPFALLVDAGSFVVSWASLLSIRVREPKTERRADAPRGIRGVIGEAREGLRFIYRSPELRAVAGSAGIFNLFSQLQITLFLVYAPRVMHLSAGEIGLIFTFLGLGGVLASLTVRRAITRFGYGRTLMTGYAVGALAVLCIPLVPGPSRLSLVLFMIVYFTAGFGIVTMNIASMALRQVATPAPLQGRVNASFRFAIGCLMPFSALLAGLLGEQLGLRPTLYICAAGMPISAIWIALSPARKLRALEELAAPPQVPV